MPFKQTESDKQIAPVKSTFEQLSNLSHPNIYQLKDLYQINELTIHDRSIKLETGDYLLVMDYIEAITLQDWIKQYPEAKVPYDQTLAICLQLASALDYVHTKKIYHQDLVPQNILIDEHNNAIIINFRLNNIDTANLDKREINTPGINSDLHALAVLFYQLISGKSPFDKNKIESETSLSYPPALSELNKDQNRHLLKSLANKTQNSFHTCMIFIETIAADDYKIDPPPRSLLFYIIMGLIILGICSAVIFLIYGLLR